METTSFVKEKAKDYAVDVFPIGTLTKNAEAKDLEVLDLDLYNYLKKII